MNESKNLATIELPAKCYGPEWERYQREVKTAQAKSLLKRQGYQISDPITSEGKARK